jgi:hypothetical protein
LLALALGVWLAFHGGGVNGRSRFIEGGRIALTFALLVTGQALILFGYRWW